MTVRIPRWRIVATSCAVLLTSCAQRSQSVLLPQRRLPPIQHVVLVDLHDRSLSLELLADAEAALASIPGVASYHAGQHLDIGRQGVDGDFAAAFIIGFETEAAYREYLDHPSHTMFVDRWRSRLEWLRVHDITALPDVGLGTMAPTTESPATETPLHRRRRTGPPPL